MGTTLPLFWHLSASSKQERIGASVKLVSALQQFQSQFVAQKASEASDAEGENDEDSPEVDALESLNAQDVSYSVRRLIRGLASPREHSRLGFAVVLTELLSRLDTVTCSQICNLVIESTTSHGSTAGQEERDLLFARLFGFTSIIQSGLLLRTTPLAASGSGSTQATSLESFKDVVTGLFGLAEKKTWLRESVGWSSGQVVDALENSTVEWKSEAVEFLIELVLSKSWSPEKIALVLKLQSAQPIFDWTAGLAPTFKNEDLLASVNLQTLARILKDSSFEGEDTSNAQAGAGSWKPQLHYVWDMILDRLLQTNETSSRATFPEFFRVVVDESLFSNVSSQQRKFWGFRIFQKALPRVTEDMVPMLFTQNFMRTWINHLSKKDRYLHKIALETATDIQSFVHKNPRLGLSFVLQLTGVHGSQQFDKLTKTKTLESLLASMDAAGIKDYVVYLLEQVSDAKDVKSSEDTALDSRRSWIIDQLATLIRNGAIPKSNEWIEAIFDWFTLNGFFDVKKKSSSSPFHSLRVPANPPLSPELHALCRTRLLSCLADITAHASGSKSSKAPGYSSDGQLWISWVLDTLSKLRKDTKHLTWVLGDKELDEKTYSKAMQLAERLSKKSEDETAKGARLLLLAMTLFFVAGVEQEEEEDESSLLETCIEGVQNMFFGDNKKRKEAEDDEEPVPPIDTVVEVIIESLEMPSAYMRAMASSCFALLSKAVQKSTVDLLIAQLVDVGEDASDGQEDIEMEGSHKDEEDEEDEEEQEQEGSDSESDASGNESSSGDEDVSSDDSEEDSDIDEEFRNQIAAALQVDAPNLELPDSSDTESDSEESMDDEQMLAIDEQLAEVFKSRMSDRQGRKNLGAQRQAMHFRIRVLDLIDVYMKSQPTSPLILAFVLPLLDLVTSSGTDEQQLGDKAHGVLKSRIAKSKEVLDGINVSEMSAALNDLHGRARHVRNPIHETLSLCSLYLSKTMLRAGAEQDVIRIYRDSLNDFVTRKNSSLNHAFIQSFIQRFPSAAWSLRGSLLDFVGQAVNAFREAQVIECLRILTSHLPSTVNQLPEAQDFLARLQDKLLEALTNLHSSDSVPSVAKDTLKLALSAIRQAAQLPSEANRVWDIDRWSALATKLEGTKSASPALRTLSKQVVASIRKQMKETSDEVGAKPKKRKGEAEEVSPDTQTRKKSKVDKEKKRMKAI